MWWIWVVLGGVQQSTPLLSCSNISGHLLVPNGTVEIPDRQYEDCPNITGVTFNTDGYLEKIGNNSFLSSLIDSQLTGAIVIPKSVKEIGNYAFAATKITSLEFESNSSLESIGYGAFADCQSLTGHIAIPNTVKLIQVFAFLNTSITSIVIPETIKFIGMDNCPQLDRVIVPGNNPFCQDNNNSALDNGGLPCRDYGYKRDVGECGDYDDSDFNATEMCCACSGGNSDGLSDMENSLSLSVFVISLCSNGNNQICINGNGTRARKVIDNEHNNCNLVCCEGSTCGMALPDDDDSSEETALSTGAIVGIVVGSIVLVFVVGYACRRLRKGDGNGATTQSQETYLGSLIF